MDQISAEFHDVCNGEGRLERKLHLEIDGTVEPVRQKNTRGHEAKIKGRTNSSTENRSHQTSRHANRLGVMSSGNQETEWQVESVYLRKATQQSIEA